MSTFFVSYTKLNKMLKQSMNPPPKKKRKRKNELEWKIQSGFYIFRLYIQAVNIKKLFLYVVFIQIISVYIFCLNYTNFTSINIQLGLYIYLDTGKNFFLAVSQNIFKLQLYNEYGLKGYSTPK